MSSFEDRVTSVVRGILSDSTQLPAEFVSSLPQVVAQNPVSVSPVGIIAYASKTSSVSTTGITFGTGADILASPLSFSADGKSDYLVWVVGRDWFNSGTNRNELHFNLDGSDAGFIAQSIFAVATNGLPLTVAGVLPKPSSGSHTINVRLVVNAGTGTIDGGTGGAGASPPILVFLQRIAIGS